MNSLRNKINYERKAESIFLNATSNLESCFHWIISDRLISGNGKMGTVLIGPTLFPVKPPGQGLAQAKANVQSHPQQGKLNVQGHPQTGTPAQIRHVQALTKNSPSNSNHNIKRSN